MKATAVALPTASEVGGKVDNASLNQFEVTHLGNEAKDGLHEVRLRSIGARLESRMGRTKMPQRWNRNLVKEIAFTFNPVLRMRVG
ncbi:unnamed protein product [Protopolystoma xenopodis]|uniref:Uncharacterized protein n=1 Tax=Protopolystoma xenopodis TaxID=117903 RepID=A0A3S5BIB8_9PLAT|nr:unnamed protein product [Protopolystoma xenopodis]